MVEFKDMGMLAMKSLTAIPTSPGSFDEQISMKREQEERAERKKIMQMRFEKAGFPQRHQQMTHNDSRSPEFSAKLTGLRDHVCSGRGGIFAFLGDRGTGKTQMSVLLGKVFNSYHSRDEITMRYCRATEYFMDLKETYGENDRKLTERQIVASYVVPQYLVIDEIQVRSQSAWEQQMLDVMVDRRYAVPAKITVLIGNLSPSEFYSSVGPSITDRIVESGAVVKFDWKSFRGGANP